MSDQYDITIAEGLKGAKPRKLAKNVKNRGGSWLYLGVAGQIGYTVAVPLVIGVLIGLAFGNPLIGLAFGAIISIIGFVRTIKNLL